MAKAVTREQLAREARNAYYREWRKRNKDKIRQYNLKYWAKKGAEQNATAH